MNFAFEPDTAAYLDRFSMQPARENQTLDDLRTDYRASLIADSISPDASVSSFDHMIAKTDGSSMRARLYRPDTASSNGPLLLYVHGGGFAVGDIESHDKLARLIAKTASIRVLTFDYGRAPENPFPTGRDDSVAAFTWATAQAANLGINSNQIAIGGESAGAAHAVAAAIFLKDSNIGKLAAIWVMSPALDATASGDSYSIYATGAGRTAAEFGYLWSLYCSDADARSRPDISPLFADLVGLAPLFIYPAEFDPARSDGEQFAEKAKKADVPVVKKTRLGLIHQYPEMTGVSAKSHEAVVDASFDLAAFFAR
jgi:acetyl esterase